MTLLDLAEKILRLPKKLQRKEAVFLESYDNDRERVPLQLFIAEENLSRNNENSEVLVSEGEPYLA